MHDAHCLRTIRQVPGGDAAAAAADDGSNAEAAGVPSFGPLCPLAYVICAAVMSPAVRNPSIAVKPLCQLKYDEEICGN